MTVCHVFLRAHRLKRAALAIWSARAAVAGTLLAAVATQAAHAQGAPKFQPPTATEFFKLRGECAKLGQKKLDWVNRTSGPAWTNDMQSRYGSDDTGRCYVAISSWIPKDNAYKAKEQSEWFLYDGQTDDLLANTGTKDGKRTGNISDPEYHGPPFPPNAATDPDAFWEWADNYIVSKVGRK